MTTINKIANFARLVEEQTIARLQQDGLGCDANIANSRTTVKNGKKFAHVNIGNSGRYMVEIATGNIFGIKALGQVHRGHFYGTLDTTDQYNWGDYYPRKLKDGTPVNTWGIPKITHAPKPVEITTVTT